MGMHFFSDVIGRGKRRHCFHHVKSCRRVEGDKSKFIWPSHLGYMVTCTCVCWYDCVRLCVGLCANICVVYEYACTCKDTHTHTHTPKHKQTNKHTRTHTHTHIHTHKHTLAHTHTCTRTHTHIHHTQIHTAYAHWGALEGGQFSLSNTSWTNLLCLICEGATQFSVGVSGFRFEWASARNGVREF